MSVAARQLVGQLNIPLNISSKMFGPLGVIWCYVVRFPGQPALIFRGCLFCMWVQEDCLEHTMFCGQLRIPFLCFWWFPLCRGGDTKAALFPPQCFTRFEVGNLVWLLPASSSFHSASLHLHPDMCTLRETGEQGFCQNDNLARIFPHL